jgi:hypothetical protein
MMSSPILFGFSRLLSVKWDESRIPGLSSSKWKLINTMICNLTQANFYPLAKTGIDASGRRKSPLLPMDRARRHPGCTIRLGPSGLDLTKAAWTNTVAGIHDQ